MVREIVLDTETTGFSPYQGARLVEIGMIELVNHVPTGRFFHQYINPKCDVPEEVVKVHGLSTEFLQGYPCFKEVAVDVMEFIGNDSVLVAHNAAFDMRFINFQLEELGYPKYGNDRVIDTLVLAKKVFAGQRNNLDALCKRLEVDCSERELHGALLDAQLLAEVYKKLLHLSYDA